MSPRVPAIVLGGTGYVAGELLRLLATHPYLDLAAVASDSQPDEPVAQFFRHLHTTRSSSTSPQTRRPRCFRRHRTACRPR